MKILHISDTHMCHNQLMIPDGIDTVIHSGDSTNYQDPYKNEPEMHSFLLWFQRLKIPNRIMIAGNHDTSLERGLIKKDYIESLGITYLFNETVEVEGLKIFGSPYTPTFGTGWAFNKSRAKINRVWDSIPEDTGIVVTHGPPRGILDTTYRRDNVTELCGDSSLLKRMLAIQPKLVCFGHIHNTRDIRNAGTTQVAGINTIFSNGSCCTDGKFGVLTSHGNVISLE